jgi:transposase-like protein
MTKKRRTKAEEKQRDAVIIRMLQEGYSVQSIADELGIYPHNLKRRIRRLEEQGMLAQIPNFSDDMKAIDTELERIEAEIERFTGMLAQPKLDNAEVIAISNSLVKLRRQKKQFLAEKHKLSFTPVKMPKQQDLKKTVKQDSTLYDRLISQCTNQREEGIIESAKKHDLLHIWKEQAEKHGSLSKAIKVVEDACNEACEQLDELRRS